MIKPNRLLIGTEKTIKNKNEVLSVPEAKLKMLKSFVNGSVLIDKTIQKDKAETFICWLYRSIRTGSVTISSDFYLICDVPISNEMENIKNLIISSNWKHPEKKYTIKQLPSELQKLTLSLYSKFNNKSFSLQKLQTSRVATKKLYPALKVLCQNNIIRPVPIAEDDYSDHTPNNYIFTNGGIEEIIEIKGILAKESSQGKKVMT